MILIAHRGNLRGPTPAKENDPEYLLAAIEAGFDVEIDVWKMGKHLYLGHDYPHHKILQPDIILNKKSWCHAKNLEALHYMLDIGAHCFWHEEDSYTITSRGFIWGYPRKKMLGRGILVLDTFSIPTPDLCQGVCSDYVAAIAERLK
jgi:hypothetical protein